MKAGAAGGAGVTVMTADPLDVPFGQALASVSELTVYVVVADGVTVRWAGEEATGDCTTASDQVTLQGGVPVRSAWMEAEPPDAMVVLPLTCAVGPVLTFTLREAFAAQLPVTATETLNGPDDGAVKVICDVLWPAVIAPAESVQV